METNPLADAPMFLDTKAVCEMLGCGPQTLRRRINANEFPEASLFPKTRRQRWRRGLLSDWLKTVERREKKQSETPRLQIHG